MTASYSVVVHIATYYVLTIYIKNQNERINKNKEAIIPRYAHE